MIRAPRRKVTYAHSQSSVTTMRDQNRAGRVEVYDDLSVSRHVAPNDIHRSDHAWTCREGRRAIAPRMAPKATCPMSADMASLAPPKNKPTPRIGMAMRPAKNQTPAMNITPRSHIGPGKYGPTIRNP